MKKLVTGFGLLIEGVMVTHTAGLRPAYTLVRTKNIGVANCWSSGPILIGGQVKEIMQRIDLCVSEYTNAVMQAISQKQQKPEVKP